ncbi:MAG: glycosyl transferase group 1 family protein [Lachnospiraceae bacterium]|jgi:glycosyltransferase involved in cell wall biosynthesis|nr:glycosyl transferase group 1 family protein [Lachnospiraceae bacterium]MDF2843392.1 glycosyl transferase group 1 family protein [Herbinix sp.]
MKEIIIVMTTLGMGGAEKSLISMLNSVSPIFLTKNDIKVDLLVTESDSPLLKDIPKYVNIISAPRLFSLFSSSKKKALEKSRVKIDVYVLKLLWSIMGKFFYKNLSSNEAYWAANRCFIPKLKKRYDLCLAYMNGTATYYAIDKVQAGKKVVWVHNDYEKLGYTDSFQRHFFDVAYKIVTISNLCLESIVRHFSNYKNKAIILENISNRTIILNKAKEFYPHEFGDISGTKILSVGRLNKQKGFDIGVEVALQLKLRGVQFKWFIIGEGEERQNLQRKIDKENLSREVFLLGLRDNPYPYINGCDIFFQPSRYEGKSITLDEAMILAKPIVVSDYDTVADSIIDSVTGLISKLNSESFAKNINRLIDDNNLASCLSENLKKIMNGNEKEIEKYYDLILDCIN